MAGTEGTAHRAHVCLQFMDKLKDVFAASNFCDLIFELRGRQFHAHRAVVAAWSPVLCQLLSKDRCVTEKIRLGYDNIEAFGSFLSFLYAGQLNSLAEENLIQVLHLATSLQVTILRHTCEEMLKRQLHIGNIISTFHVARKFRLANLEEHALNFMQMNLPEAVKQPDFLSLSPSRFNGFLSSGWVCVMKPEVKLFLIISWLGYDVKERQQYLVLLLRFIDWSTVANDFLLEISQTENFFTTNESSLYLLLQTLFSSTIPLGPYADLFPGLREKYGYLLDHIVQNTYMLPVEPEEYFPVSFQLANLQLSASCPTEIYNPVRKSSKCREPGEALVGGLDENEDSDKSEGVQQVMADTADAEETVESDDTVAEAYNMASLGRTLDEPQQKGLPPGNTLKSAAIPKIEEDESVVARLRKRRGRPQKSIEVAVSTPGLAQLSSLSKKSASRGKCSEAGVGSNLNSPPKMKQAVRRNGQGETIGGPDKETDDEIAACDLHDDRKQKRKPAARSTMVKKRVARKKIMSKRELPGRGVSCDKRGKGREHVHIRTSKCPGRVQEDELASQNKEVDLSKHSQYGNIMNKLPTDAPVGVSTARNTRSATLVSKRQSFSVDCRELKHPQGNPSTPQDHAEKSAEQEQRSNSVHSHHINSNKCEKCGYLAPSSARLASHRKHAHVKEGTAFSCTVCSFECCWRMAFYTHMRQHFPGPPHVCDHEGCAYTASKIQMLLVHRRKHTDERPYKCSHCGALFRNSNNLYAHLKCHSDDKNFECPVCKRRFRMKNTMEQHMVIHSDDRPYLCDTCGFSTKYQSHLISHKRIHTGEVYHCLFPMCKYYSPKRSQLKAHMRSHLNVRHFVCETCQKSFVEKSHLVRHRRIHQEDRPYRCEKCDYSSTRVDKLREHVERHHGENPTVKRKFAPRNKKGTVPAPSSLAVSTAAAASSSSSKIPLSASLKENHWGQNVEASIATLVSAAEEVRLASESVESDGQVYEGVAGRELVPHHSLAADSENRAQVEGYGLQERVVGRIEYTASSGVGQVVEAALGSGSQDLEGGFSVLHLSALNGKSITVSSSSEPTQVLYDRSHQKPLNRVHSSHQSRIISSQNLPVGTTHVQHHASVSLLQQSQHAAVLQQHTSASLLQQLAMSVGAASSGSEQVSCAPSGGPNHNPVVLAHSISADMPIAPHILLSTMPQHMPVSAADSLASLSLSLLSTQAAINPAGLQQALPVTAAHSALQQQEPHHHNHQQQQPHEHLQQPSSSTQQNPDYSGLNAFMALL